MGVIERCRFGTERLEVMPWHRAPVDDLAGWVSAVLTPAVTEALPEGWQGPYDVERASEWIAARDRESTVLIAVERETGLGVGLLIVATEHDPPLLGLGLGYLIDELHWGRGFAGDVLRGFVEWCRSIGVVRWLDAGVDPTNAASTRVLERAGFVRVAGGPSVADRYRLDVASPDRVSIRAERPGDHAAIRDVVEAAFGSPAEADLVERIRASPQYRADLALVAELDDEVVGHVMISGATIRGAHEDRPIVMLSPLATAPSQQGRRIGSRLVVEAVDLAERHGEPLVVLEGDPAFYARFGFEHSLEHGIVLPLPDWAPSEAGQVALLAGFDPADPSLRGEVVYPAAFDGLE